MQFSHNMTYALIAEIEGYENEVSKLNAKSQQKCLLNSLAKCLSFKEALLAVSSHMVTQ